MAEKEKQENKLAPLYELQDAIRHLPAEVNGVRIAENTRLLLMVLGQRADARSATCFVRNAVLQEEMAITKRSVFDAVIARLKKSGLVSTRQRFNEHGEPSSNTWILNRERIFAEAAKREDGSDLLKVVKAAVEDGEAFITVVKGRVEQTRGRIFGAAKAAKAHVFVTERQISDTLVQMCLSTIEQAVEPDSSEQDGQIAATEDEGHSSMSWADDAYFWQSIDVERGAEDNGIKQLLSAAHGGEQVKLPRELSPLTRQAIVRRAEQLAARDGLRLEAVGDASAIILKRAA